jgi:hypothetical protein
VSCVPVFTRVFRNKRSFVSVCFCLNVSVCISGSHPIFSVWFHTPSDYFNANQRLAVAMNAMLTFLMVSALFYGAESSGAYAEYTIALYSALISGPAEALFSFLFTRAAHLMDAEDNESVFLSSYGIELKDTRLLSGGKRLMALAWSLLLFYTLTCLFLTLLFAMQFDLTMKPDPRGALLL